MAENRFNGNGNIGIHFQMVFEKPPVIHAIQVIAGKYKKIVIGMFKIH